jgi:hypothetical protein
MSDLDTQPSLKGIKIGQTAAASGPLVIIEGKKQGPNVVVMKITLQDGEKTSEALEKGSSFAGVFEGVKVKKGTNGYADKSYIMVRTNEDSLVQIGMGSGLARDLAAATAAGLLQGDAIEVTFNGTKKLENGRTFNSYTISI